MILIRFKSGEYRGHSMTGIPLLLNYSLTTLAVYILALSYIKTIPKDHIIGN
jgi:hypothetical protein